ncbi:MAG TPA: flagellar motor protein MotA, partial [Thermoanaerobaculia bacterium]|nr:flagellar motor protein MotA [Thermoanaerobaculia bacterium]
WLSTTVSDLVVEADPRTGMMAPSGEVRMALERLKDVVGESGSGRAATAAMANLAEAIHGLVNHMRTEQQMIRDWVDSQAEQHREIRRLLEILVRENVNSK